MKTHTLKNTQKNMALKKEIHKWDVSNYNN